MNLKQSLNADVSPVIYEKPAIEVILTPQQLEREVLYAGSSSYAE